MRKKKANIIRGAKIAETKMLKKETSQKFPIGEMVSEKYLPKSAGIISSEPSVRRFVRYSPHDNDWIDFLDITIDVMWISHKDISCGTIIKMNVENLKKTDLKKVL